MNFSAPVPFEEAIRAASQKGLLPTTASSRELKRLAPEIRELATFSAKTPFARHLQVIQDQITRLVSPGTVDGRPALPGEYANATTARLALKESLRSLGYHPGTNPNQPVPGSLQDLSSDARIDLITRTLTDMARGRGRYELDRDPDRLEAWPAQELYRLEETRVQRNWPARWAAAGGQFFGGRMIALKPGASDVWEKLGAGAGGYEDTLGLPVAPFAFNSGMDTRDISREEAIDLGLLAGDEVVPPAPERGWGAALQAGVGKLSESLQTVLLQITPGAEIVDGVLHLLPNETSLRNHVFGLINEGLVLLVNDGTSEGAFKGWETRRGNGWTAQNRNNAKAGMSAMNRVIKDHQDVLGAMTVEHLGPVDFRWSVGERGIRRVYEDHKIAKRVPVVLAKGYVTKSANRAHVEYRGAHVVLAKDFFGAPSNHWVLTGYRDKKGSNR